MAPPNLPPELPVSRPTASQPTGNVPEDRGKDISARIPVPTPPGSLFLPRYIRGGSWLLSYEPRGTWVRYDGTFRVENHTLGETVTGRTASGDLYRRPNTWVSIPGGGMVPLNLPPPNPASGIPILARNKYTYYMRVTRIDEFLSFGNDFQLEMQLYRYQQMTPNNFTFTLEDTLTGSMMWIPAPVGYPSSGDYVEGDVKSTRTGEIAGRLKMGWLSSYYRKITVEIDTVTDAPVPMANNGMPTVENWRTVFDKVGFQINQITSQRNISDQAQGSWDPAELHAALMSNRDASANLDREWRYYQLVVKNIAGGFLGIMFDTKNAGPTADPNNMPREGLALCCKTRLPNIPAYGANAGKEFGQATNPFFRSAVHELGHAFGLQHTRSDHSFLAQTGFIASQSTAAAPFDTQIMWSFNMADMKRLRHWPDIFVRPGGVEFTSATDTVPPITPDDSPVNEYPGLSLTVVPLEVDVPLGAPVRLKLKMTNHSENMVSVPSNFGLSSSFTTGTVTDSSGTVRRFRPLAVYDQIEHLTSLGRGQSMRAYLTLFGGPDGPLFQSPGLNTVTANVVWDVSGGSGRPGTIALSTSSTVLVVPPTNPSHAKAAHRVLTTPEAHMVLVLGGDHMKEGIDAIHMALQDKMLGRHWAVIEARRVANKFGERKADAGEARKVIARCEGGVVASDAEMEKLGKVGVSFTVPHH